jgi:RNA polymerase sigma factor (sigma-70 family)
MTPPLPRQLLRTQSDRRLIALAASGHDRAFEAIVERYRRPLARYLRRLLSEPLAEDVVQATFVRAWQALAAGTEVRDLRPWLYRIAHNQAVNALRAAGPTQSELPDALVAPHCASAPDVAAERGEELRSALRGITALPDRQRAALMGVAVDDRPHAEVAAELGLSDGALRQLLLRARTALRAAATALTPYPLVAWLSAGSEVGAARVAEVAAGAGGIGVAVKAGAAVLAAGAVVAGATPVLHDEQAPSRATSVTTEQRTVTSDDRRGSGETQSVNDRGRDDGRSGSSGPGSGGGDDRSGSSGPGSGDDERSGSSGSSGSGSSGSGSGSSGSGSGSSGSGSDDD